MKQCRTCRFWVDQNERDTDDETRLGECRALPPHPVDVELGGGYVFPVTPEDVGCFAHQEDPQRKLESLKRAPNVQKFVRDKTTEKKGKLKIPRKILRR